MTAQLNRVEGGFQIWSRRYNRELNDVFAIQDEIAADIVSALRPELNEASNARVVRHTHDLGWGLARGGRHAEARELLDELETRAATEYVSALCRAVIYAGLGDTDRAFALLDEGVAQRNCWIGIPRMAFFEDLRRDRRFALFLERLGQPDRDRPI